MRAFGELEGVFFNENELLGTKTKDNARITIDFNSIVCWNENDNDTVTVDLFGSGRYGLNVSYDKFSEMMRQHQYKQEQLVKPQL